MSLLVRHRVRHVADLGDSVVDAVVVAATSRTPSPAAPITGRGAVVVVHQPVNGAAAVVDVVVVIVVEEIVPVQTSGAVQRTASGRRRDPVGAPAATAASAAITQVVRRVDRRSGCTGRGRLGRIVRTIVAAVIAPGKCVRERERVKNRRKLTIKPRLLHKFRREGCLHITTMKVWNAE